jgi:hypothetical protein
MVIVVGDLGSEDGPITLNLNRRSPRFGPQLLCDLSTAFPSRAFQDLSECQLLAIKPQTLADCIRRTIPVIFP